MKHLIICREYPPAPPGGIGTYVDHISRLLGENGETGHVIGQLWEKALNKLARTHIRIGPLNGGRESSARAIPSSGIILTVPRSGFPLILAMYNASLQSGCGTSSSDSQGASILGTWSMSQLL
jgi:hypothetical protein